MLCPKCGNDNLSLQTTCFYCGVDLPRERIRSVVTQRPKMVKPARPLRTARTARTALAMRKASIEEKPRTVEIQLPCNNGSVSITFTKKRDGSGEHVRLRYRGIDGRFKRQKDIDNPVVKDIIDVVRMMHL